MEVLTFALISVVLLAPAVAGARPFRAGTCRPNTLDDGVATAGATKAPAVVSMEIPSEFISRAPPVADVSLANQPNGSVADVQVLCGVKDKSALARAVSAWRFAPTTHSARAAYRIAVAPGAERATIEFLDFQPQA